MLEAHYQNTASDLKQAVRAMPWRLRLRWSGPYWVSLICGAVPATLLLAVLGNWYAVAAGWTLWALLAGFFRYKMWANQRAALRAAEQRLRPTTFRITPEWLESRNDRWRTRSDWRAVDRVIAGPQQLVLLTTAMTFHVVPRRALASTAEFDEFARSATEYHRQASQSDAPTLVPAAVAPPADDETRQVHYRNTAAEFVSLQFDGLQQAGQPARKPMRSRGGMIFVGLGFALLLLTAREDSAFDPIFGVLTFMLISLGMIGLLQPLVRRLNRAVHERRRLGNCILTISPAGVAAADDYNESDVLWTDYSSVEQDERFVAFFQNDRTHVAHLVPKHAFATADEAERFFALAERHWQQAQPQPDLPQPAETGNPYQSPAAR